MNVSFPFRPKLVETLKDYQAQDFMADLVAGVTVGIVALPLAMAFAIASGVKPEAGIFTAVIAGFIISALGGTKVSIGGPTGAFIVILYGICGKYGFDNLLICTIMAGVHSVDHGRRADGDDDQVHPLPGDHGLHQRHRGADFQHADQGLLRAAGGQRCPRSSSRR